ncbi:ABC transporter substrate-binding protein [Paenibacillus xylaniclasticus]|uniref:ABC transporter substrate-binding protein n=1 Tax=Paenibacillus xylaniclasticus TaxID=588083 RepID=UPI000FD78841|nr:MULTISPECIES: extracellular solute-binding protein [Paenibacillus]GFN34029.1 ABC transporter substrate-binding protein [Paenibacillus curdlanolyticus]
MKRISLMLVIITIELILTSCVSQPDHKPVTLKVNYPDSEIFYKRVGYFFEQRYPFIHLEVIQTTRNGAFDPGQLDIVFNDKITEFKRLQEAGKLADLSPYIRKERLDLNKMQPITYKPFEDPSTKALFGISPTFNSTVLFYNKNLFAQYGVPEPSNQMSWQQLLKLAERFPSQMNDSRSLYGLVTSHYRDIPFLTILSVGRTEELQVIDPATLKITINTPKWKEISSYVIEAFRKQAVFNKPDMNEFTYSPILMGNTAMSFGSLATAYNFQIYNKQIPHDGNNIDWGMVTAPVNPANPNLSNQYSVGEIFSISSDSAHPEEAWKFISFITNDDKYLASNALQLINWGIPARSEYLPVIEGHDLAPLTMLQPSMETYNPYDIFHHDAVNAFVETAEKWIDLAINDQISINKALERIEQEGQTAFSTAIERLQENGMSYLR